VNENDEIDEAKAYKMLQDFVLGSNPRGSRFRDSHDYYDGVDEFKLMRPPPEDLYQVPLIRTCVPSSAGR
jgi:hypothetical protein